MANRTFQKIQTLTPQLVHMSVRFNVNSAGTKSTYEVFHGLSVKSIDGLGLVTLELRNPAVALVGADLNLELLESSLAVITKGPIGFYIHDDRSSNIETPEIDIQIVNVMDGSKFAATSTDNNQYTWQFWFRQSNKVDG